MPVLINRKICDNVTFCGAFDVCPTKAIFWDKENERIGIDNSKCTSCGACAKTCPIAAIIVAKTQEEYAKAEAEIAADPRREEDLFVDRYGADPFSAPALQPAELKDFIAQTKGTTCIGLLPNPDDMGCLINSIPISEIIDTDKIPYRACENAEEVMGGYDIKSVPALLFVKDGKPVGKVEGSFANETFEKDLMKKEIEKALS